MMDNRIGFIGAGKIGEPMVERLCSAGYPTTVFARRPDVAERLAARGAITTTNLSDVAQADVVIVCVFSDEQLLDVAPGVIARMRSGSVFLTHTTGSPRTVLDLSDAARDRGVSIVDAPFSGTPDIVRAGLLTVLLSGDEVAVKTAAQVVSSYAAKVHRIGPLGTALSAKLLNNALFAACTQVTLSALAAAHQLAIPESALLGVLADASGGSTAARYIIDSGLDADAYSARISRYLTKDLAAAAAAATDMGADIGDLLAAARLGPIPLEPSALNPTVQPG